MIAAGAIEERSGVAARTGSSEFATGIVLGAGIGLAALFLHLYTTGHSTTGAYRQPILFGSVFAISSTTIPLIVLLERDCAGDHAHALPSAACSAP